MGAEPQLNQAGTLLLALLALVPVAEGIHGEEPAERRFAEPAVKAAFLLNFANFTEWRAGTFSDLQDPLVIGVYGSDEVADRLEGLIKRTPARDNPRRVKRLKDPEEARGCHMLFVAKNDEEDALLAAVRSGGILTLGDGADFAQRGGMIQFIRVGETLQFDVNVVAAVEAGLRISAKVLQLARRIIRAAKPEGARP